MLFDYQRANAYRKLLQHGGSKSREFYLRQLRFGAVVSANPPFATTDLLQLCVLGLGFLQDGDVGIGVFPEGEEILVGGESPDAGGVGICSL